MKEEQESSRQATQESAAGRTRTTAEKGGGYRVGKRPRPTWRVPYPRRPCLSGFFLVTSSWMGSQTALPAQYFLHDLITGRTPNNGSRQFTIGIGAIIMTLTQWNSINLSIKKKFLCIDMAKFPICIVNCKEPDYFFKKECIWKVIFFRNNIYLFLIF